MPISSMKATPHSATTSKLANSPELRTEIDAEAVVNPTKLMQLGEMKVRWWSGSDFYFPDAGSEYFSRLPPNWFKLLFHCCPPARLTVSSLPAAGSFH